jgi:hypothetical protein
LYRNSFVLVFSMIVELCVVAVHACCLDGCSMHWCCIVAMCLPLLSCTALLITAARRPLLHVCCRQLKQ